LDLPKNGFVMLHENIWSVINFLKEYQKKCTFSFLK
jgi:hypothetical protein